MRTKPTAAVRADANKLLNTVMQKLNLRNDAALSRVLEVAPPVISKIRHGRLPVGPSMLIRMHDATDLPIRELKGYLSDHGATASAP